MIVLQPVLDQDVTIRRVHILYVPQIQIVVPIITNLPVSKLLVKMVFYAVCPNLGIIVQLHQTLVGVLMWIVKPLFVISNQIVATKIHKLVNGRHNVQT